jgi:hypothetical protein
MIKWFRSQPLQDLSSEGNYRQGKVFTFGTASGSIGSNSQGAVTLISVADGGNTATSTTVFAWNFSSATIASGAMVGMIKTDGLWAIIYAPCSTGG